MLTVNKSITFNGDIKIDNNTVVYLNATLPEVGSISINKSIQDKEAFEENKTECLKEMKDFEDMVYNYEL